VHSTPLPALRRGSRDWGPSADSITAGHQFKIALLPFSGRTPEPGVPFRTPNPALSQEDVLAEFAAHVGSVVAVADAQGGELLGDLQVVQGFAADGDVGVSAVVLAPLTDSIGLG
jgi:hypothetical protein